MTTTQLFAASRGVPLNQGDHRCFYCGGSCDDSLPTVRYVGKAFTERNQVGSPGSPCVCSGCVESIRSDVASVPMIDGTEKLGKDGKAKIQIRWFSWVITTGKSLAATPAHRDLLKAICLDPPEPPFAICIADGNKHQLYQTPLNHSRDRIAVNCEGQIAHFSAEELRDRMRLTMKIVAAMGKGSDAVSRLYDPQKEMSVVLQIAGTYPNADELFQAWQAVRCQALTHLAFWLTPGGEDCRNELASET